MSQQRLLNGYRNSQTCLNTIKGLQNGTALVFGEDTRSFLSVTRSLHQAGMQVDAVIFDNCSPSLNSNSINKFFHLNHQAMSHDEWLEQVRKIIEANNYDIAIPCDERALYPLVEIAENVQANTVFAIPEKHNIPYLFDKSKTRELAAKCGIPVARGLTFLSHANTYDSLTGELGTPFVIKPFQSFSKDVLSKRNQVHIIHSNEQFYEATQNSNGMLLAEAHFQGTGQGVSVLSCAGKITAAFAHTRVSEPKNGGGSSYRKSIPLDPSRLDACKRFCEAINYTGVAMFEFRVNEHSGDWILIEVNARFWGSLPLAIFAGVDFPKLYACYLLTHTIKQKFDYRLNVFARQLAGDMYAIKAEFDDNRFTKGTTSALWQLALRLATFHRILTAREKVDSFDLHDIQPFFAELRSLLGQKLKSLPMIRSWIRAKQLKKLELFRQQPLTEILFVCYGNIMRSPFADKYFKIRNSNPHIKADSYGFHQNEWRASPESAIAAAQNWGIDLSTHRSKWIRQKHIKKNGQLIIVFDENNEEKMARNYQDANIISLAALLPGQFGFIRSITDPYEQPEQQIVACYELIAAAIDQLVTTLDGYRENA